jgi:hypothetical protein
MMTPTSDSPTTPQAPHTWRSMVVGLGLFCVIGGLFLSAGFKEVLWPKAVAIGGIVLLVVGLVANAILSRARPASRN